MMVDDAVLSMARSRRVKKMSPVRRASAWHRALPTPVPVASGPPVVAHPAASLPLRLLPQEAVALCALASFVAEVGHGGSSL